MRRREFSITEIEEAVIVAHARFEIEVNRKNGKISRLRVHDGIGGKELIPEGRFAGDSWDLPLDRFEIVSRDPRCVRIEVLRADESWRFETRYEIYPRGYLVCTFSVEARVEQATPRPLSIDVPLSEAVVFSHAHTPVNWVNDSEDIRSFRAFGVDFSTDERPVSCSVNLLVEQVMRGMQGRPQRKDIVEEGDARVLRWSMSDGRANPVPAGYRYRNRWGLSVTSLDDDAGPVAGQRIYHWYGRFPRYPSDDLVTEMAEYGCSILILHMPSFSYISGSVPADEKEMRRVVDKAHSFGIRTLFYCVPQLISIEAPYHDDYRKYRTENLRVWHSLKETHIVFYEEDTSFDADELCLRCSQAYEFIFSSVLRCVDAYGFDGIYVDYAWPAAGICSDPTHDHDPGIFNFSDYWRILREWREALGDEALMIGHGGGLLVSSDFVEAFDGCLSGEAQKELDPRVIGRHIGAAPTLWAMHRRKQALFRSAWTIPQLVREGMTPHTGLGVTGTSIIASLDPAHHRELLPLWQMWRAFPVERARVYTYLQPGVVEVDNDEVYYTLFATDDPYYLLILANSGGPYHDANPSVGVRARLNSDVLGFSGDLRAWRLRGGSYETFRIAEVDTVSDATVDVPEILLYEAVGFVLSPGHPPGTLGALRRHLDGRWERLSRIHRKKAERNEWVDRRIDEWARQPQSANRLDYHDFIRNRLTE